MEVLSVQMLVKILTDRRHSDSCIAKEARITLANMCKILNSYMPNFTTENAMRQFYNRLFDNGQINR